MSHEATIATAQSSNETLMSIQNASAWGAEAQYWEVPAVAELQALLSSGSNVTCLGKTTRGHRCRRPLSANARRSANLNLQAYQRSGNLVHPSTKYEKLREVVGHCTCFHHHDMSAEILEAMWREERNTRIKLEDDDRAQNDRRSKTTATSKVQPAERSCDHRAKRKPITEDYIDCEICKLELLSDEELRERKQAIEDPEVNVDESHWTRLSWCKAGCGRNYHAQCWSHWLAILTEKRAIPRELACPYCQTKWDFSQCECEQEVGFPIMRSG